MRERIAAQLRRRIVRGAVKPGEKLPPETRLMEQFGVSRPTIREAFRILETERLIAVRPGRPGALPCPARWSRLTDRFHELIVQRPGNKTLAVQGAVLHDIVATHTELWRGHRDSAAAYLLKDDLRDKPVVELFS